MKENERRTYAMGCRATPLEVGSLVAVSVCSVVACEGTEESSESGDHENKAESAKAAASRLADNGSSLLRINLGRSISMMGFSCRRSSVCHLA